MKSNNKKPIIIGAVILAVLLAVFGTVFFLNRPSANAGKKKITIEVTNSQNATTDYELSTNAEYLSQAMDELADSGSGFSYTGTGSDYGLMVDTVNGELASYENDGAYWALYVNGEYGQYGADSQPVTDGDTYTWKYEISQW